jgi:hypothetical protein
MNREIKETQEKGDDPEDLSYFDSLPLIIYRYLSSYCIQNVLYPTLKSEPISFQCSYSLGMRITQELVASLMPSDAILKDSKRSGPTLATIQSLLEAFSLSEDEQYYF